MSAATGSRRRWPWIVAAVVIVVGGAIGGLAYDRLFGRDIPVYASDEAQFKYGSIGNDGETGLPYAIWVVLPRVFPDLLPGPGGYASLGFRWEAGRTETDAPIGFSRARVGVERMAINCAFCHATSFRLVAGGPIEFALGGVSNTTDIEAYQRFLAAAARDKRFTPDVLLPAMESGVELSWVDRLLYRYLLIPITRKRLLEQADALAWADARPAWGPGRIDPFNPVKFGMLRLADDHTIGNSDMQAAWGLGSRNAIRPGAPLHWDGLNNSVHEVLLSSALGDGMTAGEFGDASVSASLNRIERFLGESGAPPSPYRPELAAIERGRMVYVANCASCHDPSGARVLTIIPVGEVGTDAHRAEMWTDESLKAYRNYREGYDWNFRHFQNVEGYVSEPLDGLWARAPYLHNGSVPTLVDLLEPAERRPVRFIRGEEVLDPMRGGFAAPACGALPTRPEFCFDTTMPGNSNRGHLYGTALAPAEKSDLVAYLLTF